MDGQRCIVLAMERVKTFLEVTGTAPNYHFEGALLNIVKMVAHHLHLCYEFVVPSDRTFGNPLPNGSWTGIFGMLQRGEADVCVPPVALTWERLQVADFAAPIVIDEFNVINTRPIMKSDMTGFIKPFTSQVWLLMLLSFLVVGGMWCVVMHRHGTRCGTFEWLKTLESSFLWTWCVLLGQDLSMECEGTQPRVLASLWLLTAFVLGTLYRSNLKAMLILPAINIPFDNVEELVAAGNPVGILEGSNIQYQILSAESTTTVRRLGEQMTAWKVHYLQEMLRRTFEEDYALSNYNFFLEVVLHEDFSRVGRCRAYLMSRGFMGPTTLTFAFPKGSSLKHLFDPILVRLWEGGILRKEIHDAMPNAKECARPITSHVEPKLRPLQLEDFFGVLFFYTAGILMGGLALIMEVILSKSVKAKSPS